MARTDLTVYEISLAGVTPSFVAAEADGNMWLGRGNEFIVVKNGSGGAINVTVQAPNYWKGVALEDQVVSVGAGSEEWIGPFPQGAFAQGADGKVYVDYATVTSVTVAVVRLPI